mmetsp:Transcript_15247/g.45612  ORF Transcript_15247/g.45612 Transcript_15247/m.45612 type:complete len:293 (+) Transcript_15247:89-967(+)
MRLAAVVCLACARTAAAVVAEYNDICTPLTEEEKAALQKEISDYKHNPRFPQKIAEVQNKRRPDPRQPAILHFFEQHHMLRRGMTVLDLGSAAGNPLKMVRDKLAQMGGHGTLTGIELVPGWVEAGNAALGNTAHLFEGDVTDFTFELPEASYDLIMMNDSMEHIITSRYACLFERLNKYTRPGSLVYMHVPSPETQLDDRGQYFENVVPPHVIIHGMAKHGFQLYFYGQDQRTLGGIKNARHTYKYVDIVFKRPSTSAVFDSGAGAHAGRRMLRGDAATAERGATDAATAA